MVSLAMARVDKLFGIREYFESLLVAEVGGSRSVRDAADGAASHALPRRARAAECSAPPRHAMPHLGWHYLSNAT